MRAAIRIFIEEAGAATASMAHQVLSNTGMAEETAITSRITLAEQQIVMITDMKIRAGEVIVTDEATIGSNIISA